MDVDHYTLFLTYSYSALYSELCKIEGSKAKQALKRDGQSLPTSGQSYRLSLQVNLIPCQKSIPPIKNGSLARARA